MEFSIIANQWMPLSTVPSYYIMVAHHALHKGYSSYGLGQFYLVFIVYVSFSVAQLHKLNNMQYATHMKMGCCLCKAFLR